VHILTFDIEDWFHTFDKAYYNRPALWETLSTSLEKNVSHICEFLDERNLKATFFWLGWEGEIHKNLIRKVAGRGHEMAAHSFLHRKLESMGPEGFRRDTERVIKTLEDITGRKVKSYRAPGMSVNKNTLWAFEILASLGIQQDSSLIAGSGLGPGVRLIPPEPCIIDYNGIQIKEFPVVGIPLLGKSFNYSSSGYFRISPYRWLKRNLLKADYSLLYFHPRDFDTKIHHCQDNLYLKLKYRIGTRGALQKLAKISDKAELISLQEAEKRISWNEVQKIAL
jgi:polysaccharide deacetylase family protein (PEP-CTERM system associated)